MNGEDFPEFFDAVWRPDGHHTVPPFPWQARLARQVVETGTWPVLLDLPTGAGKTAVIDIALFALACRPGDLPRRTVYVVDRRIVVDQVARRVERLRDRLIAPGAAAILVEAAGRLRALFGVGEGTPPVHLAELRGGIAMDPSWSLRPDVPAVLVSTVDQVGSRLLHRGYGVTDSMLPIHAGLTGNDCFYVLDEVHLSQPFAQTLRAIRSQRGERAGLPDRFQVVELSATPGEDRGDAFRLGPEDRDPEASPVLARRLSARKPATTATAGGSRERPEDALPPVLAAAARKHEGTVAVIVNRVATARRVAELLDGDDDDVLLLTGRMRPLERDELLESFSERLVTGRDRSAAHGRLFVVGTQSLEVGADFDVDALITECASWDALRQRFGRVDRDGVLSAAGTPASVTVVQAASSGADDPVYGPALAATWELLRERTDGFDAGVEPDVRAGPEAIAPRRSAPLLLPNHWRTWAHTRPRPHVEPDPALWLHGPEPSAPDVDVVWRADLTAEVIDACATHEELRLQVEAILRLLPPLSAEALPVPIAAVRAWLPGQGDEEVPVSDTEGSAAGPPSRAVGGGRRALRVRAGQVEAVSAGDVRPGDTLIVPCAYGGLARANWAPQATEVVRDLAQEARTAAGRDEVVRLLPGVGQPPVPDPLASPADQFDDVADWAEDHLGRRPARSRVTVVDYSPVGARFFVVRWPAPPSTRPPLDATAGLDQDGSDERNSFVGAGVGLRDHCHGVGALARLLGQRLGLPANVVADLELAGQLHDLGKADPRFQRWLTGGLGSPHLLAKSALRDPREIARAREASGYPRGARHELLSLTLLDSDDEVLSGASDGDLVRHLVASHHGWCRPWAPAVADDDPVDVEVEHHGRVLRASSDHDLASVGSGIADRFFALLDRYGWHGLAWLESVLRLADHRRSELDEMGVS